MGHSTSHSATLIFAVKTTIVWVVLVLLSIGFAAILEWCSFPASSFAGAMICGIIAAHMRLNLTVSSNLLRLSQAIVGVSVGSVMTISTAFVINSALPIILTIISTIFASYAAITFIAHRTGLSINTCVIGILPSATSAAIATASSLQADVQTVTLLQYTRMFMLLGSSLLLVKMSNNITPPEISHTLASWNYIHLWPLLIPIAIGFTLNDRFFSAGSFIIPMILTCIMVFFSESQQSVPNAIFTFGMGIIGFSVGLGFSSSSVRLFWGIYPSIVISTILLLVLCLFPAVPLLILLGYDPITALLSAIPLGVTYVGSVAHTSGADTTFVLTSQLVRLIVLSSLAPSLCEAIARMQRANCSRRVAPAWWLP